VKYYFYGVKLLQLVLYDEVYSGDFMQILAVGRVSNDCWSHSYVPQILLHWTTVSDNDSGRAINLYIFNV